MAAGSNTPSWRVAALVAAALALCAVAAPSAGAHGGDSTNYRSAVVRIEPEIPVEAKVEGGDDQLRLENAGTKTLYVYGYERREQTCGKATAQPDDDLYLRVEPDAVYVNTNNAAYYENQGRYGATVPSGVGEGPPKWKRVVDGVALYRFHDHRIHWMLRKLPPNVDSSDPVTQKVNDWKVPVRYGDTQACIEGRLDYIGGGSNAFGAMELGLLVAALLAMVGILAVAVRQRRRRGRGEGDAA